jgi:hypothetical protein
MKRQDNWFEHALRRTGWQPQRQMIALATLGFFISLILGALYLSQVVSDATTHRHLTALIEERDELERSNEQLRVDIARFKSVPRLQERAISLGFTVAESGQIEYLVVPGYIPQRVDTVAPIVTEEQDRPLYDETFTGWLQQQWDAVFGGD